MFVNGSGSADSWAKELEQDELDSAVIGNVTPTVASEGSLPTTIENGVSKPGEPINTNESFIGMVFQLVD
ncbi:uncharacterized protein A4U43_C07F25010 [Asparagus officinalis]|uniref:Uncharacterized protein n=1 Tax=Asparagus officinalis TaxID=4686 RepID=A0A5P1EI50_ASPOF|nr:uncharacterized protein A4U43_C07F25010 [Asparagus officinalis]